MIFIGIDERGNVHKRDLRRSMIFDWLTERDAKDKVLPIPLYFKNTTTQYVLLMAVSSMFKRDYNKIGQMLSARPNVRGRVAIVRLNGGRLAPLIDCDVPFLLKECEQKKIILSRPVV